MMDTLVVYSSVSGPRLKYVLDWVFGERLKVNYTLTDKAENTSGLPFFLSYGNTAGSLSIPKAELLEESNIKLQKVETGLWKDIPTIYANGETGYTVPFDFFSAVFFLISRYEEYLPYVPDKHGRFPPEQSLLYRNGCLGRPLVDEWMTQLRLLLEQSRPVQLPVTNFTYLPTYDIDIAYSHIFKGIKRIAGAYIKALLKGDLRQVNERTQVLKKKKDDPWDSFGWMRHIHAELGYKPIYFVLCALKTTPFDKNISPKHPAMMRVIKNLSREAATEIHPSYYATTHEKILKEVRVLEALTGVPVGASRQHYIKLKLPDTYRLLLTNEIYYDYSMGYGSQLGFRAGTGSPFLWYDLEREQPTELRVFPFCFMDTTAHFDLGLDAESAFEALYALQAPLKANNSMLITIFHNFSLGTDQHWAGWREQYEAFLRSNNRLKL